MGFVKGYERNPPRPSPRKLAGGFDETLMHTAKANIALATSLMTLKPAATQVQDGKRVRLPEQPRAPARVATIEELRSFFEKNADSILQKAKLLCYGSVTNAEEITQELYPRMLRTLERSKRGIEYPWACAHQILARLAIDHYRKESRTRAHIKRLEFPDSIPEEAPSVMAREDGQRVLKAVDSLPPRDQQILVGIFLEGCKARDVARRLGLSESRLAEVKRLALTRLREVLK